MPWPRWHRLLPRLLPRLCPTCRKIKDERERSLAHLPEGAAKVTLCRVWLCGVCGVFVVLLSRLSLSPHAKNTTHTTEPHTTQYLTFAAPSGRCASDLSLSSFILRSQVSLLATVSVYLVGRLGYCAHGSSVASMCRLYGFIEMLLERHPAYRSAHASQSGLELLDARAQRE